MSMALWNEKPTPTPAPAGRKEPLTPVPGGGGVQPSAPPPMDRSAGERSANEAALAAARRPAPAAPPAPRERSEAGGESVIAANLSIEGKIEGSGNVRMAG